MSFLVQLPRSEYPLDAIGDLSADPLLRKAGSAAWLAQLAYEEDEKKISCILKDWDLELITRFAPLAPSILPTSRTTGLIVEGQGRRFIVFTGTDPLHLANWINDFDVPIGPQGIHHGFQQALEAAWDQVKAALPRDEPRRSVWFIGHSLGGALAALAAKRANDEFAIEAEAVYVFGMPRVGDAAFSDQYERILGSRTFRFVHGDDIVAGAPPSELGYRHNGRLLKCARNSTFDEALLVGTRSDDPQFRSDILTGFRDAIFGFFSGILAPEIRRDVVGEASRVLPPSIGDHLPDRYLKALGVPPVTSR